MYFGHTIWQVKCNVLKENWAANWDRLKCYYKLACFKVWHTVPQKATVSIQVLPSIDNYDAKCTSYFFKLKLITLLWDRYLSMCFKNDRLPFLRLNELQLDQNASTIVWAFSTKISFHIWDLQITFSNFVCCGTGTFAKIAKTSESERSLLVLDKLDHLDCDGWLIHWAL